MKLPEYKDDAPLYSGPDDPPFESNIFTAMFFGYPIAGLVCVGLFLLAIFN